MTTSVATGPLPANGIVKARRSPRKSGKILLLQIVSFVVVLLVWTLVAMSGVLSEATLPTIPAVLNAWFGFLGTAKYWTAVGLTLQGAALGLALAALVGIPLGLLTGSIAVAEKSSRLLVDVARSFPVIALLPVFLIMMGSKMETKVTIIFIACVFPVLLQAQYGAQSVTPTIKDTVNSYRIPRVLRFFKVELPAATPSIMTGLRLGATTAVLVGIGVEVLTTIPGIGHEVVDAQVGMNSAASFAYIFTAGALGFGINKLMELLEKVLLRWRPPAGLED